MRAIYKYKPYVLLSKEGIVLSAGSLDEMNKYHAMHYYRHCTVKVREHDLYLNDNTKAKELPPHTALA